LSPKTKGEEPHKKNESANFLTSWDKKLAFLPVQAAPRSLRQTQDKGWGGEKINRWALAQWFFID
jgi:hypothetical protein